MAQMFLRILNMSISASYIVLAVLLLRLLLKKAPKWIAVVLWSIVAVRLVCPISIESALSLIPSAETVSPSIMTDNTPQIHTGIPVVNSSLNPIISQSLSPMPGDSANPLQIWIPVLAAVWVLGMVAMLIYSVITYTRIRRKIGAAVLLHNNVYQSESVVSPFVLGFIKPKIYLPFHMNEQNMEHVVAHEMAHIRRKDHFWKPFGFFLLTIHWFNPLVWLAYVLLCRDIELACDEKVIKELDHDARADYSQALLNCSVNRRVITACPLAFGEVNIKERVKSVLSYKKPAFWIIIVAVAVCAIVAVCFLTDPKNEDFGTTDPGKLNDAQLALMEDYPEYFGLDASNGLDVYVWQINPSSYSCGVLPHSEEERDLLELMKLKNTNIEQMRAILSTYNVDKEKIYVIPWQNPISSYLGPAFIVTDPEDTAKRREEYINYIRQLLLGETVRTSVYGLYVRKNKSDMLSFTITLNEDGTYTYYEGTFSSHIGVGEYTFQDNIVTLVDTQIPGVHGSLTHTYKFLFQYGKLIYLAEESDDFMYTTLPDGAEFAYVDSSEKPWTPELKEP